MYSVPNKQAICSKEIMWWRCLYLNRSSLLLGLNFFFAFTFIPTQQVKKWLMNVTIANNQNNSTSVFACTYQFSTLISIRIDCAYIDDWNSHLFIIYKYLFLCILHLMLSFPDRKLIWKFNSKERVGALYWLWIEDRDSDRALCTVCIR